jgi:hypothetical protein
VIAEKHRELVYIGIAHGLPSVLSKSRQPLLCLEIEGLTSSHMIEFLGSEDMDKNRQMMITIGSPTVWPGNRIRRSLDDSLRDTDNGVRLSVLSSVFLGRSEWEGCV